MLENTRFHKEETAKEDAVREGLAKELASYGDVYVNDAFGTAHRAHASTADIAKFLPAVGGFLMEKEVKYLEPLVKNPEKPFVAIIGGAKVSSKIAVLGIASQELHDPGHRRRHGLYLPESPKPHDRQKPRGGRFPRYREEAPRGGKRKEHRRDPAVGPCGSFGILR